MMTEVLIFLIIAVGSLSQAMTGIGFGMIVMAFIPYLFPYVDALMGVRIAGFIYVLPLLMNKQYKNIKWKVMIVPVLASIVGTWIATDLLLNPENEHFFKILLGFIIIGMGLYSLLVKNNLKFKANILSGTIAGTVMGFFSGGCGVAGPPIAMYYLNTEEMREDKNAYFATTITTFQLIGIVQLLIVLMNGRLSHNALMFSLKAFVPTVSGIVAGRFLYSKLNIEMIKKILYVFMLCMGTIVIVTQLI